MKNICLRLIQSLIGLHGVFWSGLPIPILPPPSSFQEDARGSVLVVSVVSGHQISLNT